MSLISGNGQDGGHAHTLKVSPSPSFQSLCIGDESVAASQSDRSLGVIFDEHMSFHARV